MKPEENIYNSICDVIDGLVDVSEFDENVYVEQTMKDPEALCED
jgi:hypothetical protein